MKKLDSVKKIKCKVQMKRLVKNGNYPRLNKQKITPGRTFNVELTEEDLATPFIKHWFTVTRGVLNKPEENKPEENKPVEKAAVSRPTKSGNRSLPSRASA